MISLRQAVEHMERARLALRPALVLEVKRCMEKAADKAKGFIGEYQQGWAPLAAATLTDKAAKGFGVPDPLLRSGELRDSLSGQAEEMLDGVHGVVGSTSPNMIFSEMGTKNEPPRPVLSPALIQSEPEIATALGELAVRLLTPGGRI